MSSELHGAEFLMDASPYIKFSLEISTCFGKAFLDELTCENTDNQHTSPDSGPSRLGHVHDAHI